jgi:murein DD-endopeptidase MepM/ murein hydrolase activator NlpD
MRVKISLFVLVLISSMVGMHGTAAAQPSSYTVQPGDTWTALAIKYGVSEAELRNLNPHFNKARQPAIGSAITLPDGAVERSGQLLRTGESALMLAVRYQLQPWAVASLNDLRSPYRPLLYAPVFVPGEGLIRDLPPGIDSLELSAQPAAPGQALGLRGTTALSDNSITGRLDGLPVSFAIAGNRFAGVVGTGAFFVGGEPELMIRVGDGPAWVQPWAFSEKQWEYQELILTGEAAQIDQQARDQERARLREIWTQVTTEPAWSTPFSTPIADYLAVSANYGARRSYNGGPYLSYHEGVDYSAYAGTPVFAPAAGTIVLAEPLYVRGGAVIINHGLGVYTGYYHLSAVHAVVGQEVKPGDILGEVGTTGLSTGNHLHWDLLINGTWVDAAAWQAQGLDCWLLEGLERSCPSAPSADQ